MSVFWNMMDDEEKQDGLSAAVEIIQGQIYGKSFADHGEGVICQIIDELIKAEKKHPGWPEDKVHAVAIMIEEAGEAMQAALDCMYAGGGLEHLRKELSQTGAMAIRALLHLPASNNTANIPTIEGPFGQMPDLKD